MKLSQAKLLVKAIPGLEKEFPRWNRENSITCVVKTDGKVWNNANHSCYAGLGHEYNPPNREALAIGSRIFLNGVAWRKSQYKLTDEEKAAYMDYILNRSPWASAFLSKDIHSVMKRKVIFTDPTQPSNYLIGAMIATRYCHEYTHWVCLWNKLVQEGVNEDFAWMVMHCTNYDPLKPDSHSFFPTGNGHACLSQVQDSKVKNFINRKPEGLNEPWNINCNYRGIDHLWYTPTRNVQKTLDARLDSLAKDRTKGGKSNNPFAAANGFDNATKVTIKDMIQIIVENEKSLLEELLK